MIVFLASGLQILGRSGRMFLAGAWGGAAVLMGPLAMNMAAGVGISPMTAALVVAVSASNTFILPTHQVNALIMRPGGYRTKDYMKAGVGATLLFTVTLLLCLAFFYDTGGF